MQNEKQQWDIKHKTTCTTHTTKHTEQATTRELEDSAHWHQQVERPVWVQFCEYEAPSSGKVNVYKIYSIFMDSFQTKMQ